MQKVRIRFAYKQGFRRIWLILSCLWLLLVIIARWGRANGDWSEFLVSLVQIGVVPVLAIYFFGVVCVWVIEGFVKADR